MRKIHDIELDGYTGPDGKFHATGVSLVENSRDPHTGIFVDDGAPEGDTTVITVTLCPDEVMKAVRQRQDPEQLVLRKLKEAGAPVQGTALLSLKTGYLIRCTNFCTYIITFEWRSK
jgi:hypothetical protein